MGGMNSTLKPKDIRELTKSTQFTTDEIKEWYRGFKQDFPCGYLTKDDFTDIYGAFFPGGSATVFVDNTFRAFDRNNNGKVDFREFLTGLSKSSQGSFEDKMKWVFQLYDTDHNGLISKNEMFTILKSIHQIYREKDSEVIAHQHVERLYNSWDRNADGELSFNEFVAIITVSFRARPLHR